MYIQLNTEMELVITVRDPIYKGDNLGRKIIFLIPEQVGELKIASSVLYLSYVRADGVPDIALLERQEEMYNDTYLQFVLPINCKLSKCAGEAVAWIDIYTGDPAMPRVLKTGEVILQIMDTTDIDDCLCDHQLSVIYQLQKALEGGGNLTPDNGEDDDVIEFDPPSDEEPATPPPTVIEPDDSIIEF